MAKLSEVPQCLSLQSRVREFRLEFLTQKGIELNDFERDVLQLTSDDEMGDGVAATSEYKRNVSHCTTEFHEIFLS